MDRLTREEIEAKHNAIAAAIALVEGMSQQFYDERWQAAADLRDLALQSIESVRSEALEIPLDLKMLALRAEQGELLNEFAGAEGYVEYDLRTKENGYVATVRDYHTAVFITYLWNWFRALSPARVAEEKDVDDNELLNQPRKPK